MRPVKNTDLFAIGNKIFNSQTGGYYGKIISTPSCGSSARDIASGVCRTCPSGGRWIGIKPTETLEKAWGKQLNIENDGATLFCPINIPTYVIKYEGNTNETSQEF